MIKLFLSYLFNSLNITFFIILLLLLEPFFKKYFSANCLYRVWVILLLGLLIPIRFELSDALFYIRSPRISVENEFSDINSEIDEYHNASDKAFVSVIPKTENTFDKSLKINKSKDSNDFFSEPLSFLLGNRYLILTLLWMMGIIFQLIFKYYQYYKYRKHLNRLLSPMNQENILTEWNLCKQELLEYHPKRMMYLIFRNIRPNVYHCPIISSPMSIGFFKPKILLPDETYSSKDLHYLLAHELNHIYRRDSFIKLLQSIAISLNWFNPVCYILSRHLDHWCEVSCDDVVLQKSTRSECLNYSKLLLKYAANHTEENTKLIMNLYGGKKNMKQRLRSIMDRGKKRSGALLLILLLGIVSTTVLVSGNHKKDAKASVNNDNQTDMEVPNNDSVVMNNTTDNTAVNVQDEMPVTTVNEFPANTVSDNPANVVNDAPTNTENVITDDTTGNTDEIAKSTEPSADVIDTTTLRDTIVSYAIEAKDTPYEWGGNDLTTGVDCSGYVQAIYKKAGYDLPRTSREQYSVCEKVSADSLLPGDLIFYPISSISKTEINHVGIYIGNGQVIHSKNYRVGVTIEDINYRPDYSAGRIITD